jgi:hypothetical protein
MRGIEHVLTRVWCAWLFKDIVGLACLVAGFTATDTAKVNAEHASLALRIFVESAFAD